jgi:hypothetical protein
MGLEHKKSINAIVCLPNDEKFNCNLRVVNIDIQQYSSNIASARQTTRRTHVLARGA